VEGGSGLVCKDLEGDREWGRKDHLVHEGRRLLFFCGESGDRKRFGSEEEREGNTGVGGDGGDAIEGKVEGAGGLEGVGLEVAQGVACAGGVEGTGREAETVEGVAEVTSGSCWRSMVEDKCEGDEGGWKGKGGGGI
jgi:hypothetical protein